jgi:NAD(P)-dependent dehydrogenase (short-subunit alcohol dehydrogenase family)
MPPDEQAATIARISVRRPGSPADRAALVLDLASAEASFITGQVFNVTGGQELMRWTLAGA